MGGKSSDKSSKQMIQMQKDEAQQARDKETARADRIKGGLERIRQAFEGSPVKGTREKSFDWGSSGATGGQTALPSGYSWVQGAGTTTAGAKPAAAASAGASEADQSVNSGDARPHHANRATPPGPRRASAAAAPLVAPVHHGQGTAAGSRPAPPLPASG